MHVLETIGRTSGSRVLLVAGALSLAAACGGKPSGGNNNNNGQIWCEGDEQCPMGMICEGNSCIWPGDGGTPDAAVRYPDIALSAQNLDFQSPLLGTEVVLPLSIYNVGEADLLITQIVVDEPGGLQEFHVSQEGSVQITIAPGAEHELQVSLLSVDAELDAGSIRIFSNDPDENPVVVTLVSEYKGTADIDTCVFPEDATSPYPNHLYDDCQVDGQGRPLIDFGVVRYEEPESITFALWNTAVGNAPLAIQDVILSNASGHANSFTVSYFVQDELTPDATSPASLPFYLSAGDPVSSIPPDLLYVTVYFDASVDVFPMEQLEIQTNDPDAGQLFLPIMGVMTGCPDDYWEINHDPSDGCEYHCVFQSTIEYCTDPPEDTPVDENCSGEADEEDAVGCSLFYRDHDGDTYGAIGDFRCLCGPEGEYTATVGLDCNDNDASVKPGVVERCITNYDDNCDGSDNDQNAQGCVNYLKDEDGDGYGVSGDVRCLCYASGFYSTTTGGDCDDNPSACGANCNPIRAENCATTYDDNCNGDPNEMNALNCVNYYRDFDMDGYGHQTIFQCWCSPRDLYTATQPTDCEDTVAAINPGATEICDYLDNNCSSGIDEGFNLQTNVNHCGSCNHPCVNPHGTTSCVGGLCAPICSSGWGNCDGNKDNGCETDLNVAIYCGSCSNHSECPTNFFCNIGTCTKKYLIGVACSDDVQCQTAFCRDGVCCNSNCGGTVLDCQACNRTGSVGTCSFHTSGTDPESACTFSAASTCGLNGNCDGAGACALYPAGTVCQAQTCSSGIEYTQDTCDGAGTCQDSGTRACGAYTCNDTATACRTSCTLASHCASGYYCNGSNQCVQTSPAGTPCDTDDQCGSNMCRDRYCCNNDCSGVCRACNLPGVEGTCTARPANTDFENDCPLCQVCNGSMACVNVTAGLDPLDECAASGASTCGLTGGCSGAGACSYWPFGTVCVAQSCSGSTLNPADSCNGTGTCVATAAAPCPNNLVCLDSVNCRTSCTLTSHCVTGYYCASGSCQPKKSDGNTCGTGAECTSGNCVDGYCCNSTCTATCMACNVASHLGTCYAVPNNTDPKPDCGLCQVCNGSGACKSATSGTDPKDECAQADVSTCGTSGNCNGSGACALYSSGTVCQPQTCAVGTFIKYFTDYCNGTGTCVDGTSVSCEPYSCGASNDCRTSCADDSHCFTDYNCVGTVCCAPVVGTAGSSCGTGTPYSFTHNATTPTGTDVTGNLVPTTVERWYRFTATEYLDDLNVWIWLIGNPGDEFRIKVYTNTYNITTTPYTSPSSLNTCPTMKEASWDKYSSTNNMCASEYTQYSWNHYLGSPWYWNDSRTFYVKVYRSINVSTPTCSNYTLRIRVGGSTPW